MVGGGLSIEPKTLEFGLFWTIIGAEDKALVHDKQLNSTHLKHMFSAALLEKGGS